MGEGQETTGGGELGSLPVSNILLSPQFLCSLNAGTIAMQATENWKIVKCQLLKRVDDVVLELSRAVIWPIMRRDSSYIVLDGARK